MRTLFSAAALFALAGCASQGDVIDIHTRQVTMGGELGIMKRETKASLDQIEEVQRQIQRTAKANDEKLSKILEVLRDRHEVITSLAPGQVPSPAP